MFKYNMGGSVPRETNIGGQRHNLAYINPFEEDLLQKYRQDAPTVPGPGGIPSYMYGSTLESTKNVKSLQPSGPQQYTASSQRDESDRQADRDRNALAAKDAQRSINRELASGTYTKNDDGSLAVSSNTASTSAPAVSVRPAVRPAPAEMQKIIDNQRPDGIMGAYHDFKKLPGMVMADLKMGYQSGMFSSPEEQRANLQNLKDANGNRVYSDFQIDEYFLQTAESKARQEKETYKIGSGDDDNIIQELATEVVDPCPEGYKMDPETNACMIDPDIGMGGPVFTPQDPNAAVGGGSGYTQPMGNFIPTPLQPAPINPMQQQLNALTKSLQPQQNQQLAGGLAGIRR